MKGEILDENNKYLFIYMFVFLMHACLYSVIAFVSSGILCECVFLFDGKNLIVIMVC